MLHNGSIHKEATGALQQAGLPRCRVEGCSEYMLGFLWAGQLTLLMCRKSCFLRLLKSDLLIYHLSTCLGWQQ